MPTALYVDRRSSCNTRWRQLRPCAADEVALANLGNERPAETGRFMGGEIALRPFRSLPTTGTVIFGAEPNDGVEEAIVPRSGDACRAPPRPPGRGSPDRAPRSAQRRRSRDPLPKTVPGCRGEGSCWDRRRAIFLRAGDLSALACRVLAADVEVVLDGGRALLDDHPHEYPPLPPASSRAASTAASPTKMRSLEWRRIARWSSRLSAVPIKNNKHVDCREGRAEFSMPLAGRALSGDTGSQGQGPARDAGH